MERLGSKDITAFGNAIARYSLLIRRADAKSQINDFLTSLSQPGRKYLESFLKKEGLKKPQARAAPEEFQRYLQEMRELWMEGRDHLEQLLGVMREIIASPPQEGLGIIGGLGADERKELSRIAGLTKRTGRGSASLNLSTNKKNNLQWISELKNNKTKTILDGR